MYYNGNIWGWGKELLLNIYPGSFLSVKSTCWNDLQLFRGIFILTFSLSVWSGLRFSQFYWTCTCTDIGHCSVTESNDSSVCLLSLSDTWCYWLHPSFPWLPSWPIPTAHVKAGTYVQDCSLSAFSPLKSSSIPVALIIFTKQLFTKAYNL